MNVAAQTLMLLNLQEDRVHPLLKDQEDLGGPGTPYLPMD